jgi:hypothetical protein
MADNTKLFDMASLAEAAYANFTDSNGNPISISGAQLADRLQDFDGIPDNGKIGFSKTQAEEFAKHYRVIRQQANTATGFSANNFTMVTHKDSSDNPLIGSGFDAIVWQGNANTPYAGKAYVSMTGTELRIAA